MDWFPLQLHHKIAKKKKKKKKKERKKTQTLPEEAIH